MIQHGQDDHWIHYNLISDYHPPNRANVNWWPAVALASAIVAYLALSAVYAAVTK